MKFLLLILWAVVASGCATRLATPSSLDLHVSDPISAMRADANVTTPKETIGEKLAFFISAVIREHPQVTHLPVYVEPSVASVQIVGWEKPENAFFLSSVLDMSVRNSLAIFCEMVGCCRLVETDESILIRAGVQPPAEFVYIHGGRPSSPFGGTDPFDEAAKYLTGNAMGDREAGMVSELREIKADIDRVLANDPHRNAADVDKIVAFVERVSELRSMVHELGELNPYDNDKEQQAKVDIGVLRSDVEFFTANMLERLAIAVSGSNAEFFRSCQLTTLAPDALVELSHVVPWWDSVSLRDVLTEISRHLGRDSDGSIRIDVDVDDKYGSRIISMMMLHSMTLKETMEMLSEILDIELECTRPVTANDVENRPFVLSIAGKGR